ncbi:HAD family hydrolase [Nanchangia anserum]|uniref:HAD family hydrolase n=1 Tax=Nanchangia anserum TaxID=2692125 RepID=A0A8I0KUG0_9ACTO|nr:HAD family hydrolase [Nanchangia anserum]MBD3689663.1 HAD family hydrolase [Nanchangia anserum]
MTRLVFLDVDGTLIDHSQRVPASAQEAVRAAVDAGHVLMLCTGRAIPEIYPDIWDLGFTGIVASNGAYVRLGADVLTDVRLDAAQVAEVSGVLDDLGAHYVWQSPDAMHPSAGFAQAFTELAALTGGQWDRYLDYIADYTREGLPESSSKCTFTVPSATGHDLSDVTGALAGAYTVFAGSISTGAGVSGELVANGVSKGAGLARVVAHLGADVADTIAVGDSANDLPMLAAAGTSIAMGNGTPEAKAAASWVTSRIDEDGLARAFAHAALI